MDRTSRALLSPLLRITTQTGRACPLTYLVERLVAALDVTWNRTLRLQTRINESGKNTRSVFSPMTFEVKPGINTYRVRRSASRSRHWPTSTSTRKTC